MKVVDITDFYSDRGGGIRSHLDAKGVHLSREGIAHTVIAPGERDSESEAPLNPPLSTSVPAQMRQRTIRIGGPAQPYDPNYHFLTRIDRVRTVLAQERPDVVEINSLYLAALAVLVSPRSASPVRTCFWHSDHVDTFAYPMLQRWVGQWGATQGTRPLWSGVRALLSRMDATLCASRWQKDKLERHGIPRVWHVPFGVDKVIFSPEARSEEMRQEWLQSVHPSSLVCLAVGRLTVEKQWPIVIDAFRSLAQRREAVLLIQGDGPERDALVRRTQGLSNVRWLGFERDRRRLATTLASADVLLHACPFETFGLGVAEAIACGLPVVVPGQGGAAENAQGAHAEIFAAGDAQSCVAAVERLLARDVSQRRAACLEARAQLGTMADHFKGVLELYQALMARRRLKT